VLAYRALGLAVRELHDASGAAVHLRRAVREALRYRLAVPAAEARMSLALVLDDLGRPVAALREIDRARAALSGLPLARATMQRAIILRRLGRADEALSGYRVALATFRLHGDLLWQARALTNRGVLRTYQGGLRGAYRDLRAAEELYRKLELPAAVAQVRHNLGFQAARAGDVPAALDWYDQADAYFRDHGAPAVALLDRAELLLDARLLPEARQLAQAAVLGARRGRLSSLLAQARLLLARVALAAGDPRAARQAAGTARRAFTRQGRPGMAPLARYVEVVAGARLGVPARVALPALRAVAADLHAAGWVVPAWDAWLDAAEFAARLGDCAGAQADLRRAAGARRGPARLRARCWYVQALVRLCAGDRAGAKRAAAAGLRQVDAYRASLGATELRAHGGAEAAGLAALRLRLALADGQPRQALAFAQTWRAGALRVEPVRPAADPVLAADLAELRRIGAELAGAPADARRLAGLVRQQRALEESVRTRVWRQRGAAGRPGTAVPVDTLTAALGPRALVEYLDLDGELHALVAVDGRVRARRLGPAAPVVAEVRALRFAARRLVLGHGSTATLAAARASLAHALSTLDGAVLAPLAPLLAGRELVLVPTGMLHALPWALLPGCAGRPLSVAPSAALWYRSATAPAGAGHTVLVAGPAPEQVPAEVAALAQVLPGGRVLTGTGAATPAVLAALDGARVAHIATHGAFRADNPLFSHLTLADGPLTVHDLAALRVPPALLVLSACDTGLSAVHPGDELVGLSAALLRLGTRTVVASVGPVGDAATRALMADLHARLAAGQAPAAALAGAQAAAPEADRLSTHSFLCLGAG